jgi:hypothetical protein
MEYNWKIINYEDNEDLELTEKEEEYLSKF